MERHLPKAILFDLDDTILAWSDTVELAWEELCDRFAARLPNITGERLLRAVAQWRGWFRGDPDCFPEGSDVNREIAARAFESLGIDAPELRQEMADAYGEARLETMRPFPGAMETLVHLRDKGVRLALLTSGDGVLQRRKLEMHGLDILFEAVLISGELGYGKPEERIFLEALELLEVKPCEAWMVGDSLEWDIETAQRLGMVGVWVVFPASKYRTMDLLPSEWPENSTVRPDWIIRRIAEIVE
ncbi:MAG: HAD-IA family hydrolase [Gemmatimonadetes bacterium]|nr:HAD-IA family hydrolase [Gemmatimonadota bacterium]